MDIPSHLPKPKLCSLRRWETFTGYGFNLHSEKGKTGQFIGKVDPNSPASSGGLKANDVLIEVNGVNVEDASHAIAVGRVKSIPDRVDLFVCDPETYKYCQQAGIKLSSAMHTIDELKTPATQPPPPPVESEVATQKRPSPPPPPPGYDIEEVKPENLPDRYQPPSGSSDPKQEVRKPRDPSPKPAAAPAAAAAAPSFVAAPAVAPPVEGKKIYGDPLGNLSLEEMRSRIGQNKRTEVKKLGNSFSEKYSMFEAL